MNSSCASNLNEGNKQQSVIMGGTALAVPLSFLKFHNFDWNY